MATDGFDKEAVKQAFEEFDKDGSGTIDRGELQDLAYAFGHVLDDEQLEVLFKRLDADGSGRIEFNEFNDWLATTPNDSSHGTKSTGTLLRAKLLSRFVVRKVSAFTDAAKSLASSFLPAPSSATSRYHVTVGVGATPPTPPPFGLFLRLDTAPTTSIADLSPPAGTRSALFFTLTMSPDASDAAIASLASKLTEQLEAIPKAVPVAMLGARAEGPMSIPDVSDKVIMIKLFFGDDPVEVMGAPLVSSGTDPLSVLQYLGLRFVMSKSLDDIVRGDMSGLALDAEACVDVDRRALRLAISSIFNMMQGAPIRRGGLSVRLLETLKAMRGIRCDFHEESLADYLELLGASSEDTIPRDVVEMLKNAVGMLDSLPGSDSPHMEDFKSMFHSITRVAIHTERALVSLDIQGGHRVTLP